MAKAPTKPFKTTSDDGRTVTVTRLTRKQAAQQAHDYMAMRQAGIDPDTLARATKSRHGPN